MENGRHKSDITPRLALTIVGAVMGSFQFGYNVGVINAPETLIKAFMNSTETDRRGSGMSSETTRILWSLTVSIFSVGGCFGGILGGSWATRFGRKGGCLLNIVFGVVAAVLMFASKKAESYEMIIVGRFIIGFHAGLYTGLSPLYLSEISTPKIRGAVGVLHQLSVVIAILLSQLLGFPDLLGTEEYWNILLGVTIIPCVLQAIILPFCPESPRFLLITKQNEKQCREALILLRGNRDIEDEVKEMKQEMASHGKKISILQLIRNHRLRPPMVIGIMMQLSQQLSGVNGVFFYSTNLFNDAIGSETKAKYATSAVGGIMVIMTIVSIPLMDRLGRRTLHLIGLIGMAVFSVLVTVTLTVRREVEWFGVASIVCVLCYMIFFAVGPGSIPWLIVAELFSHGARPGAMSVCVLVNWLSSFIVGFVFPTLQGALADYTFIPFTVILIIFSLFTVFFVPETKGKTFEEIAELWPEKKKKKQKRGNFSNSLENITEEDDIADGGRKTKYGTDNEGYSQESENSTSEQANQTKF